MQPELAELPDERLFRLEAVLGELPNIQQMLGAETMPEGVLIDAGDRLERLGAALSTVCDNFLWLGEVAYDDEAVSDPLQGVTLDDKQTELVMTHMYLTSHIARRFVNRGEPLEDLQQVAAIGLLKSAVRFDPELGYAFSSFAGATIEGEIKRHFRDHTWSIRVPRQLQEVSAEIPRVRARLEQAGNSAPTTMEIAEELEVDEGTVLDAMKARQAYRTNSLDAPIGMSTDGLTLADSVEDEGNQYEDLDNTLWVDELLAKLDPREELILRARAGLPPFDREHAQSEIAEIVGISQMHVSRLCDAALLKLSNIVDEK